MSAITMRRKSGPKEISVQDLAKAKARGGKRPPATNGNGHGDDHINVLKRRLNVLLTEHGGELSEDDRSFATSVVYEAGLVFPTQQLRAENLLTSFERRNGKANGHAPAVAGDELLPAETGATVPAGIAKRNGSHGRLSRDNGHGMHELRDMLRANRPVPEDVAAAVEAGHEVELDCRRLQEHPDNRDSRDDDADIVKLAASIKELKQQQPILVRPTPAAARQVGGDKEFEVIFGERRWRACRVAGVKVRAKVRTDLTDAQVLELIGVENGLRKDLNPIERARHIEVLCRPLSELGGGKTLEEAAPIVGLKDPASVSNCRRLLKLPKWLQDLVASGELAESFARCLLSIAHAPKLMDQLRASWDKHAKGKQCNHCSHFRSQCWDSRRDVEGLVKEILKEYTRPVDGSERHYGWHDLQSLGHERSSYSGKYGILFDAEKLEVADALEIHEFQDGKDTVRLATNSKLYDKHQVPAIKKLVDGRAKKAAAKAGRDKSAPKKELTPAQKKARDKEQAEQLQKRIDVWLHEWLKELVAREVDDNAVLREVVLIWIAAGGISQGGDLEEAVIVKAGGSGWDSLDALRALGDDVGTIRDCGNALVKAALQTTDSNPKYPAIEHQRLVELAVIANISLPTEWKVLQESHLDARLNGGEWAPRLEVFFELFQSAQLDALGEELKVHVAEAKGKEAKIQLFMTRDRILPLPKIIKPLPAAKAGKPAKKGKR